jgi:hypothetical protein
MKRNSFTYFIVRLIAWMCFIAWFTNVTIREFSCETVIPTITIICFSFLWLIFIFALLLIIADYIPSKRDEFGKSLFYVIVDAIGTLIILGGFVSFCIYALFDKTRNMKSNIFFTFSLVFFMLLLIFKVTLIIRDFKKRYQ